jgi:hypothetical protein
MAAARVGSPVTVDLSASSSTLVFGAASHTTGNAIVVCAGSSTNGGTISGIADTAGNTYTQVASAYSTSATAGFQDIWAATNITGNAANIVTVTLNSAQSFRGGVSTEYSGVTGVGTAAIGAGVFPATGASTASISPTAGSLLVSHTRSDRTTASWAAGSGFTGIATTTTVDTYTQENLSCSAGSQTADVNSGTSINSEISVAEFLAGAAVQPEPRRVGWGPLPRMGNPARRWRND